MWKRRKILYIFYQLYIKDINADVSTRNKLDTVPFGPKPDNPPLSIWGSFVSNLEDIIKIRN